MSIQGWSRLTQALAVLGVLAGVFAMHGLTGNHDVTMVDPQLTALSSATEDSSAGHPMASLEPSSSKQAIALGAALSMVPAAAQKAVVSVDEHQHMMADACLAMLTALVLLLALLLGLRSLLAWRAAELVVPAERPVLTGRSPPWLVPSLSKLCVLRT